ncbi:PAS domain S-box protein [Galbibacter sp. EGI 63066]|uniref:PAS domain S-box protein n=1 Tax=Galbibacter sp. EGI 63066 TaxID=2993559 RepID=UPI0022488094|nr:PAS domain S-box protein [Galbibacter sp. EGI 63066]MCX2679678.1 PAS domain S-box protein [Galbibacter sp. EGI 63066]
MTSTTTSLQFIEHCPVPVALFDNNLCLLIASNNWFNHFKQDKENSNGKLYAQLLPKHATSLKNIIEKNLGTLEIKKGQDYFYNDNEEIQWLKYETQPWIDENGIVNGILLYLEDITKLKEYEKIPVFLEETNRVTQTGTWFFDIDNETLEWSADTKKIYEVPNDFVPDPTSALKLLKEEMHVKKLVKNINNAVSKGNPIDQEVQIITPNNKEKWIRITGKTVKEGDRSVIYGICQDINDKKTTESRLTISERDRKNSKRALDKNKQLFTSIFNSTFQFTGFLNIKGKVIDINEPALNIGGLKVEDVINKYFWDTFWWQDSEKEQKKLKNNFKKAVKGEFIRYEAKILDKNKETIYIDFSLKPVLDNKNRVNFLIAEGRVIQEMVEARKKLKESEKLHRTLLELSPTGLVLNDAMSGEFLDMNESFKAAIGYSDRELLKMNHLDTVPPEDKKKELRALKEVLDNGRYGPYEGRYVSKNNELVPALITRVLITNSAGRKLIWSVIQDISHIKEKEEELMEVINVASEQNNRLLNFAHIVSHNLRSHASNFSMLIELLGIEDDIFKKVEIIEMLNSASKKMLETIANLNEIIAINTNLNIKTQVANLNDEINEAFTNISELMKNNFVEVENNIPDDLNIKVVKAYLESILLNIFTNAIKYKAPNRYPKIKIDYEKIKGYLVLTIEDNGLGVDLKKHGHKLFGMYKTFHGNRDARGIGLFITKNQIEAMKGKIEAESEPGKGTKFKIYFNENY